MKILKTALSLLIYLIALSVFAEGENSLTKTISIPEGVTTLLNNVAVREDGRIKVSGTPGYWNNSGDTTQGDLTRSREAAFDGDDTTFFDPRTELNLLGNCWAAIEFEKPYYVMKIRYKGRPGGSNGQLRQLTGCIFQGANLPDFSDAEEIAVANVDNDAVPSASNGWKTWNGVNYWAEIEIPFIYSTANPFSEVARSRKAYKYLRIIGPTPYANTQGPNGQNGMCCGNVSELEFYGLPQEAANSLPGYHEEEYRPVISGQQSQNDEMAFDMTFKFLPNTANSIEGMSLTPHCLYGYEVFRQTPNDEGYSGEITEAGFMMAYPGRETATFSFVDPDLTPGVRYMVRAFNIVTNTLEATYITPNSSGTPSAVTVSSSTTDKSAIISWNNPLTGTDQISAIHIYRGTAPGGPWTLLDTENTDFREEQFTDSAISGGVTYYYQLCYLYSNSFDDNKYEGPLTHDVEFRFEENIERTWSADGRTSTLKPGMEAICHYGPWDNSGNPANLFDNNFSTFSDIVPKSDRTIRDDGTAKAGVDLGATYVITRARIYPRTSSERYRFSKLALFGSNADSAGRDNADGWRANTNCTQLTERFSDPTPFESFFEVEITDPTPYRYVFIQHAEFTQADRNKEAFANAAELQLFGYRSDEAAADILLAPTSVTMLVFSNTENQYGKIGVAFSWVASPNATSYQIEQKEDNGDWQVIATNISGTSYFHELQDISNTGSFRIASVREDPSQEGESEFAYARPDHPYAIGEGTGLWAVYTCPYENNIPQRKEWIKRVDATIQNSWGNTRIIPECTESTNDVHIVWSGKLIAPLTGVYQFRVDCDDAFALRIDSTQVINNWDGNKTNAELYRGEVFLEAGEHKIRADYHTIGSAADKNMFCNLSWGGVVDDGPIPPTQLIPEPLPPMSYPWLGENTFEAKTKGYSEFSPTYEIVRVVGEDGSESEVERAVDGFIITGAGDDFWIKETAAHMVWRMVTGDFYISAKFERQINEKPSQFNDSGWAWKGMLVARKDLGYIPPLVCASYASNGFEGRADLKIRDQKGGDIYDYEARTQKLPPVIYQKLQRVGNVFTQSFSEDGVNWQVVKTYVDEAHMLDGVLYVGPAVSSIKDLRVLGTYRVTVVKVECDPGSGIVYIR